MRTHGNDIVVREGLEKLGFNCQINDSLGMFVFRKIRAEHLNDKMPLFVFHLGTKVLAERHFMVRGIVHFIQLHALNFGNDTESSLAQDTANLEF
jgi:hypothetical protein